MGQTLTHGIYLPDEGERNCYDGLAGNWQLLDGAVGTVAEHTTQIAGKAPLSHTHTKSEITDFPAYGNAAGTICEGNDSRLSDARTPVAHTHTKSDVTDLLNSNFIPSANNSYDLGSSSYQWNNLYAKNYYYNGTQWGLDQGNTWTGRNSFRNFGVQSANTIDITQSTYANSQNCGGIGFSDAVNRFWGDIELNVKTDAASEMVFNLSNWKVDGTQGVTALRFRYDKALKTVDFFGADRVVNLGTSTNKWKTLNGINPGALSLPNPSAAIELDATGWDLTGATSISYTSTFDGWLELRCADVAGDYLFATCGEYRLSVRGNGAISAASAGLALTIPVRANISISIIVKASSRFRVFLIPCLGNV